MNKERLKKKSKGRLKKNEKIIFKWNREMIESLLKSILKSK